MATISHSDKVFATVTTGGREICSLQGSGFTGFGDVMRQVRNQVAHTPGMVMVTVRNSSQGWTQTRHVYLAV